MKVAVVIPTSEKDADSLSSQGFSGFCVLSLTNPGHVLLTCVCVRVAFVSKVNIRIPLTFSSTHTHYSVFFSPNRISSPSEHDASLKYSTRVKLVAKESEEQCV